MPKARKWTKNLIYLVMMVVVFAITPMQVWALGEGEYVEFGSDEYQWELGNSAQIGVYVKVPEGELIDNVKITIEYSTDMLEYNVADVTMGSNEIIAEIEDGVVVIETTSIDSSDYKKTLHFIPVMGGITRLTVTEVVVDCGDIIYTDKDVKTGNIYIGNPVNSGLEGLTINGGEIPDFNVEDVDYAYTIDAEVEEVEVEILPEGLEHEVELLDNVDLFKYAVIYITNDNGYRYRFTIDIFREPPTTLIEAKLSPTPEQDIIAREDVIEKDTPEVLIQGNQEKDTENISAMTIVIVELVAIFIVLLLIRVKMTYRNIHKEKHGRKKGRKVNKRVKALYYKWSIIENIEIIIDHVTMRFKLERDEASSIKESIIRKIKKQIVYDKFKALDDVSLTIKRGEVLGIIGTNGSGKSTLLKIVSGALEPSAGTVLVDRSRVQLLTLGTGFDYELTGRENVYLNGSLNGYTKEFINEKYDDIVAFAELEGFIDERVKNYSSGMVSRLAFAIATIRETPEILILDEVLGVGDMFFREKSNRRIKEMINSGSTVLIVSHSVETIKENCTKAVWIEKGKIQAIGNPKVVCAKYVGKDKY